MNILRLNQYLIWIVCGLFVGVASINELHAQTIQQDEARRYQAALERIAQGHWQWAVEELNELIRLHPEQAGARLDLAVLYCQMGSKNQSLRVLSDLEALGSLPPGIQSVVDMIRTEDCLTAKSDWVWQAGIGGGYTNNANFGVANRSIPLGPNAPFTSLELGDQSLPQGSSFVRADFQAQGYWDATGRLLHTLSAGVKHYGQTQEYDTQWVQWMGQTRHELGPWPLEQRFLVGQLQLNGQNYLTQAGYGQTLWWQESLEHSSNLNTLWGASYWRQGLDLWWTHQRYAITPLNDSWRLETKYILEAVGSWSWAKKLAVSVGPVLDKPVHERVGGDRQGWMAQLLLEGNGRSMLGAYQAKWQLSSGLQVLHEQRPYNFLFDNEKRSPKTWFSALRWVEPVGSTNNIYLQMQHNRQKDPIPLFNYSSWTLEMGYLWH